MIRNLFYTLFFVALPCMQAASLFNFDNDAVATATAFTDVNNGISAAFTSNGDPGGFVVIPSFFSTLTGNVLLDPGPAGLNNLALTVNFSQPLSDINLGFAIDSGSPSDTFKVSAYLGSKQVGSTTASGSIPAGFSFPEGTTAFSGATFDSVVFSTTGLDLAVDNISVDAASAPEPATLPVVGLATVLGAVIAYGRKRLRQRCSPTLPMAGATS